MAKVELTKDQKSVVLHEGSTLLVSAAAGSGKTKVLVDRLLRKVCDPVSPCNIDDFLIITYTKAAAAELRNKIAAEIGNRLSEDSSNRHLRNQLSRVYLAQISTVHAFCSGILRDYSYLLDIPVDFRVGEENECQTLRQKALEQVLETMYSHLEQDPCISALLSTLGHGRDDRQLKKLVLSAHQNVQCHADPQQWMDACMQEISCQQADHISQTVWGKYLLDDMSLFLSQQIQRMEYACSLLPGSGKTEIYLPVFQDNLELLKRLSADQRWDVFATMGKPNFGTLPGVRNCDFPEIQAEVKSIRDSCKDLLAKRLERFSCDAETALNELLSTKEPLLGLLSLVKDFTKEYNKLKRQRHILDFADLEHMAICLLVDSYTGAPTATAREIGKKFREIMVDEYQDSNRVQDTIFRAISRNGNNLFMVGDVKQSIYQFRLADPGIFLEKYHTYETRDDATSGAPRKILLSENFRSRPAILEATNHVFSTVMSEKVGDMDYGDKEALRTIRTFPDLHEPAVELHCIQTDRESEDGESADKRETEANFVAQRIRELLDGEHYISDGDALRKIREEDIVILMRSLSTTSPVYLNTLAKYGIRATCERTASILESTEVCSLLAWLQIIDNPHQDIPLVTAMASPLGGFSADALAQIRSEDRYDDFFDALTKFSQKNSDASAFLHRLQDLREARHWMTVPEIFDYVCSVLQAYEIFGSLEDGLSRTQNLRRLREYCVQVESIGITNLSAFLRHVDDLKEQGNPITTSAMSGGGVTIMSIHKSKGLEFPVVFLSDLSHRFNMEDLNDKVLMDQELMIGSNVVDQELMIQYPSVAKYAISAHKKQKMISEEMRVLYVAMTRAKERLIMTFCAANTEKQIQNIAMEAAFPAHPWITGEVNCMGQWVLMSAAVLPEAGHLFGGSPKCVTDNAPWLVQYHDDVSLRSFSVQKNHEDVKPEKEWVCLNSDYAHSAATSLPAKLTATQLKGRVQDAESAEYARPETTADHFSIPRRIFTPGERPLTPAQRGTATHLFMQYCDFSACTTVQGIEAEKNRLLQKEFLSPQQLDVVDADQILQFFQSDLGRLMTGKNVRREFKFSIMMDSREYAPNDGQEEIMLQGVVDCFLLEPDGITVLDFKTDYLIPGQEEEKTKTYAPQLTAYARALERIYGLPVKRSVIYYFSTGTACEL